MVGPTQGVNRGTQNVSADGLLARLTKLIEEVEEYTEGCRFAIFPPMAIRKLASLSLILWGAVLLAQPPAVPPPPTEDQRSDLAYTLAHYTKYEYRIPMRDGVRLFASVYVPKDAAQPYPIIMLRTPYNVGPYGADS